MTRASKVKRKERDGPEECATCIKAMRQDRFC